MRRGRNWRQIREQNFRIGLYVTDIHITFAFSLQSADVFLIRLGIIYLFSSILTYPINGLSIHVTGRDEVLWVSRRPVLKREFKWRPCVQRLWQNRNDIIRVRLQFYSMWRSYGINDRQYELILPVFLYVCLKYIYITIVINRIA